jgi:hypothetical protein
MLEKLKNVDKINVIIKIRTKNMIKIPSSTLKCFICEKTYYDKRFHYSDYDFCSHECFRTLKDEEIEKTKKKVIETPTIHTSLNSASGSAY